MKIYFLSARPCALFLNGAYFGRTDLFERFAEISAKDGVLAEFIPEHEQPIRFFITEKLRVSPPDGCEVYLLPDGVAVYANDFPPTRTALEVIWQKRLGNALATLFKQGETQLTIEEKGELFLLLLPDSFLPTEIFIVGKLVVLTDKRRLAVFEKMGKRLLFEKITEFRLDGETVFATLPLSDRLQRYAECEWSLSGDTFRQTAFTLKQRTDEKDETAKNDLTVYAFFESLLIGANFDDFLSDGFTAKKEELASFLGDFIAVTLTENPNEVGLVYKKAERLFEVKRFRAELENGRIADIKG